MAKDFYREMALAGAERQHRRFVRRVMATTPVPTFLRRLRNARVRQLTLNRITPLQHRAAIQQAAVRRRIRMRRA